MSKNIENSSEENIDFYELIAYIMERPLRISIRKFYFVCLSISSVLLLFLSCNVLSIWRIILCVGFILLAYRVYQTLRAMFYNGIYTVENFEKDYECATEYVKYVQKSNKNNDIPEEYYSSGYQMIRQFLIAKEQSGLNSWFFIHGLGYDLRKKMMPKLKLTPIGDEKDFKRCVGNKEYLEFEYPDLLLFYIYAGWILLLISAISFFVILWKTYF